MRKTKIVTIDTANRDKGKSFLLTEMPAAQAFKWAARAFLAMAKGGAELPEGIESAGMAGLANVSLAALSSLDWALAEPLLDELMTCVQIKETAITRALDPNAEDCEEIATIFTLHKEVLMLHVDFSKAAALLTSPAPAASVGAPITRMSRQKSGS